jgi:hypothetical protein
MLFNRDSAIQSASKRFWTIYKSENLVPCQSSGQRDIPSGRPSIQSIIRLDDENFSSGPSSVSRRFELLQLASVRTFQQHVQTTLSVRQASGFLFKTQLWEYCWNRSDNMDSRPDALIHKASITFKSRHPDDGPHGSDVRASHMESTCIRSTIQMTILLVRTC